MSPCLFAQSSCVKNVFVKITVKHSSSLGDLCGGLHITGVNRGILKSGVCFGPEMRSKKVKVTFRLSRSKGPLAELIVMDESGLGNGGMRSQDLHQSVKPRVAGKGL